VKIYGRFMLEDLSSTLARCSTFRQATYPFGPSIQARRAKKESSLISTISAVSEVVTRTVSDDKTFAMTILATDHKKDKLAGQLAWLANRQKHGLPEDRRHERIAPRNPVSVLHLMDGRQYECRIIDLSLSGAAIEIDVKPALGAQVVLGTMRGEVVRHFDEGVAIEFAVVHSVDRLESEFSATAA
jgi:hypothetical protein